MFTKLLILVLFHSSSAVIYELNDEDYALMPPIFHMDDYEDCLEDPEGLYCTYDIALVSDEPSQLLTMMQEYSEHTPTHYNHTLLRHAVCITRTCKQFYDVSEGDLGLTLEACANETFYNKYKLKTRVSNDFYCAKREKNQPVDYVDIAVAVVCVAILITNIVASFCDYYFEKGKDCGVLKYVYCFSIFRNWDKLMTSPTEGKDPRVQALKGLHGIRTLSTILVITGHSLMLTVFLPINTTFVENFFIADHIHILLNGSLIMQTFLIIASLMLVYNWLISSERQAPSWKMLPKQYLKRWLRLTPSYAVILALTATWFGRMASGPYWKRVIGNELADCRRDWWKHLLYINNYVDNSDCILQSWYLAVDLQLYCLASAVFVMCRTVRRRKVVLSVLFMLGVLIPTLHTYYQNLSGVLLVFPELILELLRNNPTYDNVYKRGHTNLTGCVIGMVMGYIVYEWQKTGRDPKTFRKYRVLYWSLFPLGCLCCYSGTIFYTYSPPPSLAVNLLYAAFMKPIFGIIISTIMIGVIIQFEGLYRTVLEWRGWTVPSQLSYSAYLLHVCLLRNYIATQTTTHWISPMVLVTRGVVFTITTFAAALIFWMLVEAPFRSVVREYFAEPEPIGKSKQEESMKNYDTKKTNESPTRKINVADKNFGKKRN